MASPHAHMASPPPHPLTPPMCLHPLTPPMCLQAISVLSVPLKALNDLLTTKAGKYIYAASKASLTAHHYAIQPRRAPLRHTASPRSITPYSLAAHHYAIRPLHLPAVPCGHGTQRPCGHRTHTHKQTCTRTHTHTQATMWSTHALLLPLQPCGHHTHTHTRAHTHTHTHCGHVVTTRTAEVYTSQCQTTYHTPHTIVPHTTHHTL